mgnify:FL=1
MRFKLPSPDSNRLSYEASSGPSNVLPEVLVSISAGFVGIVTWNFSSLGKGIIDGKFRVRMFYDF